MKGHINGLAGGLEMYFGEDILRTKNGTLSPVHWNGFDSTLRAYQGELESKPQFQKAFLEKVHNAKEDTTLLKSLDWSGMRAIFDQVLHAFENQPPSAGGWMWQG